MSYPNAKYPSEKVTIQDMPERIDGVDTILAEHINKLQQEVIAIQEELGVLPKGDAADVATRIGAHIDNDMIHRVIHFSTVEPESGDGNDGDVWLKYES